jgi:hypothetical protein
MPIITATPAPAITPTVSTMYHSGLTITKNIMTIGIIKDRYSEKGMFM